MRRIFLLSLLLVTVLTGYGAWGTGSALAARPKVAAKTAATARAEANDTSAVVVQIKAGEKITVVGTQGDYSQIVTAAGKKGWVPSKAVGGGAASTVATTGTTVAAAEGSTDVAMRGRPTPKRRTIIVGMGGMSEDTVKRVADILRKNPKLDVVGVRSEPGMKPGSPAGGVAGAEQLGAAQKADLVVGILAGAGSSLQYEVVDLKSKAVLASGVTPSATDPRVPVDEVAAGVSEAVDPPKAPDAGGGVATPSPAVTPDATTHPNAPLDAAVTPAPAATATPNPNKLGAPGLRKR